VRSVTSLTIFLAAIICAGTFHVAHGHHHAEQRREADRIDKYHERLREQCKLKIPNSPAKQRDCFEDSKQKV
jgi:hypothetical protein